jgi:ubiquinone/menaquinone biosynthesis methyltransferase
MPTLHPMGTPITPYGSGDAKKAQVAQMFDNIAHRYDFLNHFFSLGIDKLWRRKAVRMLLSDGPVEILDVATGTADFAIEAAGKAPELKVIGVDISAGMLDIGRTKVARAGQDGRVELVLGDGESLPFEDGRFDAFTVAFGVRNFEHAPLQWQGVHPRILQTADVPDETALLAVFPIHHADGGQMVLKGRLRLRLPP